MSLEEARDGVLNAAQPTYLGDGVEATFDGYQIWLTAGDYRIALEPDVMVALTAYANRIDGFRRVILKEMGIA